MLESIVQFHDSLPFLIRVSVDYFIGVILIRGWLGNEILSELQKRGLFEKGYLHKTIEKIKNWTVIARKLAIVQHFRSGHGHDSVVGCGQGRCGVFTQA